jgi:uncharacterized coiled-coil DUF342 family protein
MMTNETIFKIIPQPEPTCPTIDGVISQMEQIRKHVEKIREWGQEWKDMAIGLDEQLDSARDEIRDLEEEISKLQESVLSR